MICVASVKVMLLPFLVTAACPRLLLFCVVLSAKTESAAAITMRSPAFKLAAFVTNVHVPSTVGRALTVIAHVAVLPPSVVVTVMVAVPGDTAVTTPLVFTFATASLSDFQETVLSSALSGVTVAVRFTVSPSFIVCEVLSKDTLVTWIGSGSGSAPAQVVM